MCSSGAEFVPLLVLLVEVDVELSVLLIGESTTVVPLLVLSVAEVVFVVALSLL